MVGCEDLEDLEDDFEELLIVAGGYTWIPHMSFDCISSSISCCWSGSGPLREIPNDRIASYSVADWGCRLLKSKVNFHNSHEKLLGKKVLYMLILANAYTFCILPRYSISIRSSAWQSSSVFWLLGLRPTPKLYKDKWNSAKMNERRTKVFAKSVNYSKKNFIKVKASRKLQL